MEEENENGDGRSTPMSSEKQTLLGKRSMGFFDRWRSRYECSCETPCPETCKVKYSPRSRSGSGTPRRIINLQDGDLSDFTEISISSGTSSPTLSPRSKVATSKSEPSIANLKIVPSEQHSILKRKK